MVAKRILVVEDDPVSRKLVRDVLRSKDYDVVDSPDGEGALVIAGEQPIDLVVMDISLPGIDGIETMRRLRLVPGAAAIPVLAVSAHAMPGDDAMALAAGCASYMTKPLRLADLVTEVRRLLREAPVTGSDAAGS